MVEAKNLPALQKRILDIIAEYDEKLANARQEVMAFEAAGDSLKMAATINGKYGNTTIDTGRICANTIEKSLLKSAWLVIYDMLQIKRIASAADKRKFECDIENPAPFTLDNIRSTFGNYILDPRGNILRGLAEVFCTLDQSYKSHEKVKIGVQGLPKRIILTGVRDFGWGRDRLENILNALAQYQGKPLVTHQEVSALLEDENALLKNGEINSNNRYNPQKIRVIGRGVRLRRFNNGNGHLFFEPDTLKDINLALAEYYGEVLPDAAEEKPTKRAGSTAVSKDLQYYPTPISVIERVLENVHLRPGIKVLEPSCGCGRFMDAIKVKGAEVFGIEVDFSRANQARAKGHNVLTANFLETSPVSDYDFIVMNPPFYGKHYAMHIEHAQKFLKPGGRLISVLPVTARYDHGLLNGRWEDLPIGSFRESGTNINTTILTIFK